MTATMNLLSLEYIGGWCTRCLSYIHVLGGYGVIGVTLTLVLRCKFAGRRLTFLHSHYDVLA